MNLKVFQFVDASQFILNKPKCSLTQRLYVQRDDKIIEKKRIIP